MHRILIAVTVLIAFLLATPAVLACGHDDGKIGACPKMAEALGFSPEQQTKIDALAAKLQKKADLQVKKLQAAKEALDKAWAADKPNKKAVLKAMAAKAKAKGELAALKVEFKFGMLALFTPEQKAKVKEMMAAKHGEGGCKCHKGEGGCDCQKGEGGCNCQKGEAAAPAAAEPAAPAADDGAKPKGCGHCDKADCPHHKKAPAP